MRFPRDAGMLAQRRDASRFQANVIATA